MRTIARATPGVLNVKDPGSRWMRLGPEAGDLVVFCKAGWRFSDPDPVTSNPIPGNHGHPATRPIPFFLSGGHPRVPRERGVVGAGPHPRRRAHRGRLLRAAPAAEGRVRRTLAALSRLEVARRSPGTASVRR